MRIRLFGLRHYSQGASMKQYGKILLWEESGFSLIELMIYLVILGILMTMVFSSFIQVIQTNSSQWRIGETKIETGIGLDLLRADLEHAGFGLPWEFPVGNTPVPYSEPAPFSDVPNVPRAVVSDTSGMNGSARLAIKGMNVVRGSSSQKWGWLGRDGDAAHTALVKSMGVDVFQDTDRVIVIRTEVSPGENRQLILNGTASGNYFTRPKSLSLEPFAPPQTPNDPNGERYILYGLDDIDPQRPFNRTDYYINNANVSSHCAPGTGTLEKATLNQDNDNFSLLPIVDCAADFQVVYYLDTNGDGGWDTRATAAGLAGLTAKQIRTQVKFIRCYVLTHEGGVDRNYTHPNANINVGEVAADGVTLQASAGRTFTLNTDNVCPTWANYRWKVYSLAVTPRNL